MEGNIPSDRERFDLSGQSFLFVLGHIFDPGVECIGLNRCHQSAHCSKAQALTRFARRKFEFEERLMRLSGYPGFDRHAEDHRRFIGKLEGGRLHHGSCDWLLRLREVSDDWTRKHLSDFDHDFGEWADSRSA